MPSTIKLGDTGDDVKRLQRVFARTKVLGPDNVDGVFGAQTEKAVKDFQQSNGLVVDGVVGPITWSHIHPYREASPTLQTGSLGPVVAMASGRAQDRLWLRRCDRRYLWSGDRGRRAPVPDHLRAAGNRGYG
jgi:hypothetical protein